jgi:hypothetical protein
MSDENVEFVRRAFEEVVARAFEAYWREPRSIAAALEADDLWPEWRDLFAPLDPEVEAAEGLGEDQVLAVIAYEGHAKNGPQMSATFHAVFTLRNDVVVGVHEYTTRVEALAAVGKLRGS